MRSWPLPVRLVRALLLAGVLAASTGPQLLAALADWPAASAGSWLLAAACACRRAWPAGWLPCWPTGIRAPACLAVQEGTGAWAPVSWKSGRLKRVVTSTFSGETQCFMQGPFVVGECAPPPPSRSRLE